MYTSDDVMTLMDVESKGIFKNIWTNYKITIKKGKPDFDNMLDNIHKKIGSQNVQTSLSPDTDKFKTFISKTTIIFRYIAASLFIPLLITTLILLFHNNPNKEYASSLIEIKTLPGTITHLTLSDSTGVWLSGSTTFCYPNKFTKKERNVVIKEGEAYFEVESDKKHPFIVNNSLMKTTVTGTKFNIDVSMERGTFKASLLEGNIVIENNEQKLSMKPGSIARYDHKTRKLTCNNKSTVHINSWINGIMIFDDELLEDVFKKLKRQYNIDFVLLDDDLNNIPFTAKIRSENIEHLLDNMKKSLPINYTIKEDISNRRVVYIRAN
ncbi:hypothetical protein MASR2M117_13290 [Paludibacter sp.]